MKHLIGKYEQKVQNASKSTETDEELVWALLNIFKELFQALQVKSGLVSMKDFLHTKLTEDVSWPGYIAVCQITESCFDIVIGTGELLDESKTAKYEIDNLTFTVRESIGLSTSLLRKVDEKRLSSLIAEYRSLA